MPSPVVSAERLAKHFTTGFWHARPLRALEALDLEVPSGGVFGLLGPNGAGKSTTLKLLLDLIRPTAGRCEVFGRPPGDADVRRRVGFLPELPSFYDHLTAEELMLYFGGLFGYPSGDCRRRAAAALDRVGLGAERSRPLRQYSRGMLQRMGLAQALVNDPELVVLDEPMSGLDPVGRREIRALVLGLRDEGRTVLFSSHILSDAELLCSHVAILAAGRLVASGAIADLTGSSLRGSEVVVSSLPDEVPGRLPASVVRATRIGERRFSLEVAAGAPLEPLIAELVAAGARLISVTPLGATLEDVFLRVVEPAQGAGGLHTVEAPGSVRASDSGPAGADGGRQIRSGAVVSPKAGGVGRRILLVARHVFKESVRDRAFYAIAVFAGLVVAFSLVVGQLSAGQEVKIVKDVGLAAIEIAGALMAALTGVGLVAREIERRSIVSLLAKPLARWEFVVGKYLGLLVTILVNVAGMAGALYAVLAWLHGQATPLERAAWDAPALDATLALAVVMVAAEIGLLTAVALFFSSFSSSAVMSVTFTTGVFVAGLLRSDIRGLAGATDVSPVVAGTASTVGWFLPAFDAFDIKSEVVHGLSVPSGYVPLTLIYAALYAAALVVGAVLVFSRRDFK